MRGRHRARATPLRSRRASNRPRVVVDSEWATLREVVVGRPFLCLPRPYPVSQRRRLGAAIWGMLAAREGLPLAEAFPQLQARVSGQMREAVNCLEREGVVVHDVPPFAPAEIACVQSPGARTFQYFTRDLLLVVGDRVIELAMRGRDRCRERLPMSRLLGSILAGRPARRLAMEPPRWGGRSRRALLEGGDCLVTPAEVLVGLSGRGSNRGGIRWLRAALGGERAVTGVPLAAAAAHLDSALCLVRPGLGLRCPDLLPAGVPESLRDWRWVDVTPAEALEAMAVNCLPISPDTILVPEEAPRVAEALARCGQRVLTTPFSAPARHGGGLRCWTQPLSRTS